MSLKQASTSLYESIDPIVDESQELRENPKDNREEIILLKDALQMVLDAKIKVDKVIATRGN